MTFSHTQVMLTKSHELTHLGAYETMVVRVSEWDLWQSDCEFKKKSAYLEIPWVEKNSAYLEILNLTFPFPKNSRWILLHGTP